MRTAGGVISIGSAAVIHWDFEQGLSGQPGGLAGALHGSAKLRDSQLQTAGSGYLLTAPLQQSLRAKTLVAWVQLDTLEQAGGGDMTVQSRDGVSFDTIVFGERDPQQWLAGSNGFVRTQPFSGPQETAAVDRPVQIAIAYHKDGTIVGYRNGEPYGKPYRSKGPFHFQAGVPISSMFPEIAKVADELAVVRSMMTPVNEHAQGNFFMHSGFPFMGHPSAGAWCAYGLGTENENLPGFVVLQSGGAVPPHGGVSLFSSGYLPAQDQASILQADRPEAICNIQPQVPQTWQRRRLELAELFDTKFQQSTGDDAQVEAAIRNYETAFRMQTAVPELCDIRQETAATRELYGVDSADPACTAYARQCLLARRLVEKGVRFIELSCLSKGIGAGGAANPWDQHGDLARGHGAMGYQVDKPIAALLTDLRARGLLDETLVAWAGEFGRTPFSQGNDGRDHNPFGFSIWMAGGGVRGGMAYGATDELGYQAVENPRTVYDLWATVLHLLGVDHERLTFRYSGRDFRLTDVHGNVIKEIIA